MAFTENFSQARISNYVPGSAQLNLPPSLTERRKNDMLYLPRATATQKYTRVTAALGEIDVPIHNSRAENAVRPFCVGRKNWLFSTSVKGAEASARLYSVAATACANGMKVEEYLTELFRGEPGVVLMPW